MKVLIDKDEWYPVYAIREGYGRKVDISEDLYNKVKRAEYNFMNVQEELEKLYEKGEKHEQRI